MVFAVIFIVGLHTSMHGLHDYHTHGKFGPFKFDSIQTKKRICLQKCEMFKKINF